MEYKFNRKSYIVNEYMDGRCPGCKNWEAPITTEELAQLRDTSVHKGSSPRTIDTRTVYTRQRWKELFQCPRCKTNFAVPYSNT